MKTSLIISTYKSPQYLERVLASVVAQKTLPFEVIITEDGEFEENRSLIESWKKDLKFATYHLTQKDLGNRKPLALNKAILKATGDYLIFIDGDCILRSDFIADHLALSDESSFITGRRVELSQKISKLLTVEKIKSGYLETSPLKLWWDALAGETHHLGRMFKTPRFLRNLMSRNEVFDIRGCNFSVHRQHMISVNGFDNSFSGAYGEDSDVEYRLKFLGLKMKSIKGAAIQYHLWHPTQKKDASNQERLEKVLHDRKFQTTNGLSQALSLK